MKKLQKINEDTNFPSQFAIDDCITFIPSARQADERKITREERFGTITMVHFSKAKVFYDVLDDYTGEVFEKLDSCFVQPINSGNFEKIFESAKRVSLLRTNINRIIDTWNKKNPKEKLQFQDYHPSKDGPELFDLSNNKTLAKTDPFEFTKAKLSYYIKQYKKLEELYGKQSAVK